VYRGEKKDNKERTMKNDDVTSTLWKKSNYVGRENIRWHDEKAYSREEQKLLNPLLRIFKDYDSRRRELENFGGSISRVNVLTGLINKIIHVSTPFGMCKFSLSDPVSIKKYLDQIGNFDLHLDIRVLPHGMPVYYLSKIKRDFWSEYSLVIEDIYLSPGFPFIDERFVKFMISGHETYFLRLSTFRERTRELLVLSKPNLTLDIDEFLYCLGRYVFQAAWHEDQRLARQCSTHFGLTEFTYAIELLYLCLSGELCELRSKIETPMLQFFSRVYTQPAIFSFLKQLQKMAGIEIAEIQKKAMDLYSELSKAFSKFLKSEIVWGYNSIKVPLFKLVFGNFSRMETVAKKIKVSGEVCFQIEILETKAQEIIEKLLKIKEGYDDSNN
jgi:hypothetical protein